MRRPGDCKRYAIGDVGARKRLQTRVNRARCFLVALEPHNAELSLDQAGGDLRDPDRFPIELQPQRAGDRADSVLDRRIARSSFICLESSDRADIDDVTVWRLAQQRDARPGDEHHAQHVDLPHPDPVRVDRLGDRRQAEGAAGVVDEDVDAPKALAYLSDETLHAVSIGHVKLEGEA